MDQRKEARVEGMDELAEENEVVGTSFGILNEAMNEVKGVGEVGIHNDGENAAGEQSLLDVGEGQIFDVEAAAGESQGQFPQFTGSTDRIEDGTSGGWRIGYEPIGGMHSGRECSRGSELVRLSLVSEGPRQEN